MVEPPLLDGAVNETVAPLSAAVAVPIVGASGTVVQLVTKALQLLPS